ncbi:MAG TPA: STAS domain-containing protein [Streptosporangiaceae bacterium]|jgi:anti-sigma B factor antagonist|nr:STAS domain-containing protein [Streptosporangiaceae bacterium]
MPGQSPFAVRSLDGLPVVTAPAEIDIRNASELAAALLAAATGHPTVVADLGDTEFCDSSGLSVLVMAMKRAQADGGELRLVVRAPSVLRVFAVTGVDKVFRMFASLPEAVAGTP